MKWQTKKQIKTVIALTKQFSHWTLAMNIILTNCGMIIVYVVLTRNYVYLCGVITFVSF